MDHKAGDKVSGKNYLWESLIWGILAATAFGFLMFVNIGNVQRAGFLGIAVFFVGGCIFGAVSVWHRRGLRMIEQ